MKTRTLLSLALIPVLAFLLLLFVGGPTAHAAGAPEGGPIPWLDDIVAALKASLVKMLQDLLKGVGIVLWAVLKLCGAVGLLGNEFSTMFEGVITEALNAVISGDIRTIIRGSLMVSLGLFGLSLLARPFWPDLKVVNFQRAAIWGMAIQAYLLNAPSIYSELETWRVDLADQVAQAVSSGSVPGCSGDTVETILCITGATPVEILDPSIKTLPDTLPPYGYTETIGRLYDHCAFNPPFYYGDPDCDSESPEGDPWEVMGYVQDAMGTQFISLILGFLILAYGVLQIALGLAAGMMFVLFPVAAMFAFYLPLESFPAGVIRNYISIFLKSIVLLTLAAVVVRLFTVASASLLSLAAVGVVGLLICGIMAKEALASLLSSVSFVGNSVSSIGAGVGLGGAAGAASSYASPESRMASMMIGGGPVAQALMGAPNPYLMGMGGGGGALGIPGAVAGKAARGAGATLAEGGARQAMAAAFGAGGGIGLAAGAVALGARAVAGGARQVLVPPRSEPMIRPGLRVDEPSAETGATQGARLVSSLPTTNGTAGTSSPSAPSLTPVDTDTGTPAAAAAVQNSLAGQQPDLSTWSAAGAEQIQSTAGRLGAAPPEVQAAAADLAAAGHTVAQSWMAEGRSPVLDDGSLDPALVEETVAHDPATAAAFSMGQRDLPAEGRVSLPEAVALGAATQRTIPARDVGRRFAGAVKRMNDHGFEAALQGQAGAGSAALFGSRAGQAHRAVERMQRAGLASDLGRQLVETVHSDLRRDPNLTAAAFRDRRPSRMRAWDQATGDAEATDRIVEDLAALGAPQPATVTDVPRAGASTTLRRPTPAPASPKTPSDQPAAPAKPDSALVEQLSGWRAQTANQMGRRAFHVLTDATLRNVAAANPQTLEELQAVKGIGPKKMDQFGDDILAITRNAQTEESNT